VLLGEPGEKPAELLEGRAPPAAGVGVDAEVEPPGGPLGLDHPPGHGGLDGDVLEVGRAAVEQQRQLPVVQGHLAEDGGQGPEPEAQAESGRRAGGAGTAAG
jgi:hypothetical protein